MNKNTSLLENLHTTVSSISWPTKRDREKAIQLISAIFNQYTVKHIDFRTYLQLSSVWFDTILTSPRDRKIKNTLIDLKILECDDSYNVDKGIAKGYRIENNLLLNNGLSFVVVEPNQNKIQKKANSLPCLPKLSHTCCTGFENYDFYPEEYILEYFKTLGFIHDTLNYIPHIAYVSENDVNINYCIESPFGEVQEHNKTYTCSLETALKNARAKGVDLIEYEKKWYIEPLQQFLSRKSAERAITYSQQVFNIDNDVFFASRNDTNNRLDHSLTGLKKELFSKILFDGESLLELDIANSQFAICPFINPDLDKNFIQHVQSGKFYEKIASMFGCDREAAKELIVKKIAFGMNGNLRKLKEYPKLKKTYPKFIQWMESFKEENGYKSFAVMLQKAESHLVIDGLFKFLTELGYKVFPIHDSMRVKESELLEVKSHTEKYFESIGFKCFIRHKKIIKSKSLID